MDNRPKHRRAKDNPYKLYIDSGHQYHVAFIDGLGVHRDEMVTAEIFTAFSSFELEDISQMNEFDRHIEHSELTDEAFSNRILHKPDTVTEQVEKADEQESLREAIQKLPSIQRRRLVLYYFERLTYEEISSLEGCSARAVKYSVDRAIEALKKFFRNF